MLDHRDRSRAAERQIRRKDGIDARHVSKLYGVAPVRVVKRLVGQKAVDLRCLDSRIFQAGLDRLEMERVGGSVWTFSDRRLTDPDDGAFATKICHVPFLRRPHKNAV